jgi:hypothetical protein
VKVWVVVRQVSSGGFTKPLGIFTTKKQAKKIRYRPGDDPSKFQLFKMEVQGENETDV